MQRTELPKLLEGSLVEKVFELASVVLVAILIVASAFFAWNHEWEAFATAAAGLYFVALLSLLVVHSLREG
jgi:hypothetical protein